MGVSPSMHLDSINDNLMFRFREIIPEFGEIEVLSKLQRSISHFNMRLILKRRCNNVPRKTCRNTRCLIRVPPRRINF